MPSSRPAEEIERSLPSEQVGRPLFWSCPWRLISRMICSSLGGVERSVVLILPPICTPTGAVPVRGSFDGRDRAVEGDDEVALDGVDRLAGRRERQGAQSDDCHRRREGGPLLADRPPID